MPAQMRTDRHRDEDDHQDLEPAGQRDRAADHGGEERREPVLAVDADVEQVHPEAEADRERREVVRTWPWLRMSTAVVPLPTWSIIALERVERVPCR